MVLSSSKLHASIVFDVYQKADEKSDQENPLEKEVNDAKFLKTFFTGFLLINLTHLFM